MIEIYVLLIAFCMFFLRDIRFFYLSPITSYIFFLFFSIISTVVYNFNDFKKINLFYVDSDTNEFLFYHTLESFLLFILIFLISIFILKSISNKKYILQYDKDSFISTDTNTKTNNLLLITIIIYFFSITIFLIHYGDGFLTRDVYLPKHNQVMAILSFLLMFITVILLGKVYPNRPFLITLLFILLIIVNLSTGSRKIFIYFILFIITILPYLLKTRKGKITLIIYIISSIMTLLFVVQLRGLDSHGLIPYLNYFSEGMSLIFNELGFVFYYTFIYGFYVTAQTIDSNIVNIDTTLISLNPLPGNIAGWYDISQKMRIHPYAPFNMYGEIFSMGEIFIIISSATLASIFFYFELTIRKLYFEENRKLIAVFVYMFLFLFIIYSYEYNFRSAFRLIYYLFFLLFIFKIFKIIKYNIKSIN